MKTILIIGVDSDIGNALKIQHLNNGDIVHTTSRNGKGTYELELAHPRRWPKLTEKYDRIYYTIGINDIRSTRIEVMQINAFMAIDCIHSYANNVITGGDFVCLTSAWGSVNRVSELNQLEANRSTWYKMSRAAFNMGVVITSRQYQNINWILMHPGVVNTKGTVRLNFQDYNVITPSESAIGIINSCDNNENQLNYLDYNGNIISF